MTDLPDGKVALIVDRDQAQLITAVFEEGSALHNAAVKALQPQEYRVFIVPVDDVKTSAQCPTETRFYSTYAQSFDVTRRQVERRALLSRPGDDPDGCSSFAGACRSILGREQ